MKKNKVIKIPSSKSLSNKEFKKKFKIQSRKKEKQKRRIISIGEYKKYIFPFESYDEYLQSDLWKLIRKRFIGKKRKCQLCRKNNITEVHHFIYRAYGKEEWKDLIAVCHTCHFEKLHKN